LTLARATTGLRRILSPRYFGRIGLVGQRGKHGHCCRMGTGHLEDESALDLSLRLACARRLLTPIRALADGLECRACVRHNLCFG
jgi:hypothetical protein